MKAKKTQAGIRASALAAIILPRRPRSWRPRINSPIAKVMLCSLLLTITAKNSSDQAP
jgi:hypothetical protein